MSSTSEGATLPSEQLTALAEAHGISTSHWSFFGERVTVPEATLRAVLTALGVQADTPEQVEFALASAEAAPWQRLLPPSLVSRPGEHAILAHVRDGHDVTLSVALESGETVDVRIPEQQPESREVDGARVWRVTAPLPIDLPLGWHTLNAREHRDGTTTRVATATLAIVPERLPEAPSRPENGGRSWGLMAQLYSVRSEGSWGIGDLADLADLAAISGARGADFVLLNPLHAGDIVSPIEPSPYLPTTRRFVSPLYIRPERIAEYATLAEADREAIREAREAASAACVDRIDRDASWAQKRQALRLIFEQRRSPARQAQFDAYRARRGAQLGEFASWCAAAETDDTGNSDHHDEHAAEFHAWLQWVLDEQLTEAQAAALASGMSIGLMHDLAVGVDPAGYDAGNFRLTPDGDFSRSIYARGLTVGAPPDMYSETGQNWSQPPWNPAALAEAGYAPLRDTLRELLRHAGALRIDHVMGLFRLWCIPAGHDATRGVYLRYDHDAMLGVLALEAHRAGATIIGEDLGTVEPWVRDALAARGVLGTSVLWFERDGGALLAPEHYRRDSLATVTTHDLPPTATYLESDDGRSLPSELRTVEALHRYVASSPARLVGVALTDAVGETRAQNVPGTHREYPNWQVPLAGPDAEAVILDQLPTHPRFVALTSLVDATLRRD